MRRVLQFQMDTQRPTCNTTARRGTDDNYWVHRRQRNGDAPWSAAEGGLSESDKSLSNVIDLREASRRIADASGLTFGYPARMMAQANCTSLRESHLPASFKPACSAPGNCCLNFALHAPHTSR